MWLWFVAGLTLGWLIEWIIDWNFWRREIVSPSTTGDPVHLELARAQQTIRLQENQIRELKSRLAAIETGSLSEVTTTTT